MTAGLLIAKTYPNHPELDDATFNDWYSNQHIQDVCSAGLANLAIRYKNLDLSAKWQYLAIYRLPDLSKLSDEQFMASIRRDSPLLPGKEKGSKGGDWTDTVANELSAFEIIQRFEGQTGSGERAKGLVTVGMEPEAGTDDEFDDWYRKQVLFPFNTPNLFAARSCKLTMEQHLDMMSMLSGYERSTRYKKLDGSKPRYLAVHEYATTKFPLDGLKLVTNTEWAKKVIAGAQTFDRDRWEYISEYRTDGKENL